MCKKPEVIFESDNFIFCDNGELMFTREFGSVNECLNSEQTKELYEIMRNYFEVKKLCEIMMKFYEPQENKY